jgi:hypothetical protein
MRTSLVPIVIVIASTSLDARVRDHDRASTAPRIWLGAPGPGIRIAHATLTVERGRDEASARLAIELATDDTVAREAELAIELPSQAHVTGLVLEDGHSVLGGQRIDLPTARMRFATHDPNELRDPAYVEVGQGNRVVVHAFPVMRGRRCVVELALMLPGSDQIVIDPGGARVIETLDVDDGASGTFRRDVITPIVVAIAELRRAWFDDAPTPAETPLDRGHALYAGALRVTARPIAFQVGGGRAHLVPFVDHGDIRRAIRPYLGSIQKCYERTAHGPEGDVEVELDVGADGDVEAVPSGGALDDIAVCIAEDARTWRFPRSESAGRYGFVFLFYRDGRASYNM